MGTWNSFKELEKICKVLNSEYYWWAEGFFCDFNFARGSESLVANDSEGPECLWGACDLDKVCEGILSEIFLG